jgi:hypothetical protein
MVRSRSAELRVIDGAGPTIASTFSREAPGQLYLSSDYCRGLPVPIALPVAYESALLLVFVWPSPPPARPQSQHSPARVGVARANGSELELDRRGLPQARTAESSEPHLCLAIGQPGLHTINSEGFPTTYTLS